MALLKLDLRFHFLWFAVEHGQKGHCHGQLDEGQLQSLLVVYKLCVFLFT
jgi:hypothetical protein